MSFQWRRDKIEEAEANRASFEGLPPGMYKVVINDIEDKHTKSGGKMLRFSFEVVDSNFAGRKIFENFNYENPIPRAEDIGWAQLSDINKACHGGAFRDVPFHALVGKTLTVQTGIRTWDGENYPTVKKIVIEKPKYNAQDKDKFSHKEIVTRTETQETYQDTPF